MFTPESEYPIWTPLNAFSAAETLLELLETDDATGGSETILTDSDNLNREIELTRQNEELMRLLDERGRETATISLAEARARLSA